MDSCIEASKFSELIQRIGCDVAQHQKPHRLLHIYGVIQTSLRLASINGVDLEQAALAAMLHDCAKHVSRKETLQLLEDGKIKLEQDDMEFPAIWHGPVAAWIAKAKYGITDLDVLNAVENHTLGCANPSTLLQVLMCADTCEPGRSFEGAEELRTAVRNDLRMGLAAVLKAKVCEVKDRGKTPHPRIFETMKSLES